MSSLTDIPPKKCGQILLSSDDEFLVTCDHHHCENKNLFTLVDFRDHLYEQLPKLPSLTIIKAEDSSTYEADCLKPNSCGLQEDAIPPSTAAECEMGNLNGVIQLGRTRTLQTKSENENDCTKETTEKKAAYSKQFKNSFPVPVILSEIYQIETNETKGCSGENIIEANPVPETPKVRIETKTNLNRASC